MTEKCPVAIIGIGCLFPKAASLSEYWANIRNGIDAITETPPTHWRPEDYLDPDAQAPDRVYTARGGFLSPVPFPPLEFGITPNALEAIDSTQLLGLLAAREALADSGYSPLTPAPLPPGERSEKGTPLPLGERGRGEGKRPFEGSRVSVILGVTGTQELVIPLGARLGHPIWRRALNEAGVSPEQAEDVIRRIADSYVSWQEDSFPGLLGNVVAGRIANRLDLGGTNCVVDAACASSLAAVHLAALELASGRADMVLSGGMDTFNDIFMYTCFSKTPALSPTGDARPFDAAADGTILGEGLGCLVLKRLADAERDGDRIYAVIRGVGTSSDGMGQAIYAPSSAGQVKALRQAYRLAGVTPDTIELVEAHGTGTRAGDAAEVAALTEVYQEGRRTQPPGPWCALGSVKSQIGHTKAAAGAAGLIKAALALYHKVLPPTLKVKQPIEPLQAVDSPFYAGTEKRPWLAHADQPRRAAVSAFGFGGSNYHCVLEEHRPAKPAIDWDRQVQILAFSAATREQLLAALPTPNPGAGLSWAEVSALAERTRSNFRSDHACRLTLVVERDGKDLPRWPQDLLNCLTKYAGRSAWNTPDGIFFGSGPRSGKLAFLFPGQGSQYVGMLRDLACQFPQIHETLAEANAVFGEAGSRRLSDCIYPLPAFSDTARNANELALRATAVAQPVLGCLGLGALRILRHFGVNPDAVAGHSFGELVALCAAGRFDAHTLHVLARERGRLMAGGERQPADDDRGAMLAIRAGPEEVAALMRQERLDLVVANKNAPHQTVLAGATAEIERAAGILGRHGVACQRLPVAAAFHSPFVASVEQQFAAVLARVEFAPPRIPVFANSTAREYPHDPEQARALLAGQLARPVEFVQQVENVHASGVRTFVEAGPGNKLTALVSAILEDRPHEVLALDASSGQRSGQCDLARLLAHLAALGHPVVLERWQERAQVSETRLEKKPTLTIPICGANYVKPKQTQTQVPPAATGRGNTTPPVAVNGEPKVPVQRADLPAALPAPVTPAVPAAYPIAPSANGSFLAEAVRTMRENVVSLQKLGEQTAQLHRQFLDGQDRSLQVLQSLLEEQQKLFHAALGTAPPPVPAPLPVAAPAAVPVADAVAVPVPVAVPAAVPAADDRTRTALLEVVAEKTGYPTEMLDLDLELDRDLGIDSIKRVEILAALQERLPEAPVVKSANLGSLRTLRQVIEFLVSPVLQSSSDRPQSAPVAEPVQPAGGAALQRYVLVPAPLETSRPPVVLDPDRDIWVMDDGSDLGLAAVQQLRDRGHKVRLLSWADLSSLERPDGLAGLVILAPSGGGGDVLITNAFRLLQLAEAGLRQSGRDGGALLATVARLDGSFGLTRLESHHDAVAGGLAGLTKTAAHEWPEVTCKAIDLATSVTGENAAAALVDELLLAGATEVGLTPAGRGTLQLTAVPLSAAAQTAPVQPGEVIVVTGGGRGVTAEAAVALAQAFLPTLVLLGRTPEPDPEPAWLACCDEESAIKKALLTHRATRASPQELGEQCRQALAAREIRRNLERLRATGAQVFYRSVDVREEESVRTVIQDIRQTCGPIRGLIHGAGVLADRLIADKTLEQFAQVYGTKVAGLRALLQATAPDELKLLVLFSSSSARFGRSGQADYAAANEVLNKLARQEAGCRPGCRVVSINWGPWDGGMVTPALKERFASEGIDVIPPGAGADYLVREVSQTSDGAVEVVVLAGTSLPPPAPTRARGTSAAPAGPALPPQKSSLPTVFEQDVNLEQIPVLASHVLDGHPVLPLALTLEWLAHAALHGNPGLLFHGCNDLRVLKGVVLQNARPCRVRLRAGKAARRNDVYLVPVEMDSDGGNGLTVLHARAEIVLAARLAVDGTVRVDFPRRPYEREVAAIYRELLFHGPDLQGIERVETCTEQGVVADVATAPAPAAWLRQPLRSTWLADPLVLDTAFQLLVLWSWETQGCGSLPCFLGRYRQYRRSFPAEGVQIRAAVTRARGNQTLADLQVIDHAGEIVARLENCECVSDHGLNQAFRRNRLVAGQVVPSP